EHHPMGDFALEGERVRDQDGTKLTFAGIGMYNPKLFAAITPGSRAALAPLLRDAMRAGRVGGMHYTGLWVDVGTPDRLAELDALVRARSGGND
ncbi:MAG TPA: mannose-1-phosphate guanylyltransferase, partial [Burkholderiales bacterium]|nr:mannose-1-phosphate guanylyltransferase [Burkholderiales bacterium]